MNPLVALAFALLLATPVWAQQAQQRPAPAPKTDPRAVLRAMEDAFSAVADRVTPAVVHVSTVQKKGATGGPEEGPERFKKRSEEHTSELQSQSNLVCRLLLEKKNNDAHCTAPPH